MKARHQLAAYLGLLGLITLIAILMAIRDRLVAIGPWVLNIILACLGAVLLYFLHKLYVEFRIDHIRLQGKQLEIAAQRQGLLGMETQRQMAMGQFALDSHLARTRIYPDKGYMPVLVNDNMSQLPSQFDMLMLPQPSRGGKTRDVDPDDGPDMSALPGSVRYEEIRSQVPYGRSCLGVSAQGVEHCDFGQLMTMWIAGGSGTGKSNTVALKIDEAIRNGRKIGIVLIDPHARKEDSLYNRIRCYEGHFLFQVAVSEDEIYSALVWFKDEFERRLGQGGHGKSDILLVVDEVSNVVESDDPEIGKLIKKIARICGQESRGFGMFGWFISQDAAGLAWLRKRAMTVIAHKLNMMSERKLACNEDMEIARSMDEWPRGRVAVYGLNFQGVMIAQMPSFNPPVVDGSITMAPAPYEDDEMEPLRERYVPEAPRRQAPDLARGIEVYLAGTTTIDDFQAAMALETQHQARQLLARVKAAIVKETA